MFISTSKFRITTISMVLFVFATAFVHAEFPQPTTSFRGRQAAASGTLAQNPANLSSQSNHESVTALPILLKQMGCAPREITRPKGNYLVSVVNLSGQRQVVLQLVRENGQRLHEKQLRDRGRWKQLVHLTPGTYFLREVNHPDRSCKITITPQ
jgi:hypothetical protein